MFLDIVHKIFLAHISRLIFPSSSVLLGLDPIRIGFVISAMVKGVKIDKVGDARGIVSLNLGFRSQVVGAEPLLLRRGDASRNVIVNVVIVDHGHGVWRG